MGWDNTGASFVQFYDQSGINLTGPMSLGPFAVDGLQAARTVVDDPVGGGLQVRWDFYADPGLQLFTGAHIATCRDGSAGFTIAWPMLGAYMMLRLNPTAPMSLAAVRIGAASSPGKPQANSNQNMLITFPGPTAILAGTEQTTWALRCYPGPATWDANLIDSATAPWEAFLESVSNTGVVALLDYINSTMARTRRLVYLPARDCRIRFRNTDAAAHTYYASLTGSIGLD